MAEDEGIILLTLRQIGCEIEENVEKLSDLTATTLVAIALQCLDRICPDQQQKFQSHRNNDGCFILPKGVASRHKVATQLCTLIKEIGYPGECGYNTFLYPNEKDTQKLLLWMIENIPKTQQELQEDILSPCELLNHEMQKCLESWRNQAQAPHFANLTTKFHPSLEKYQLYPIKTSTLDMPKINSNTTKEQLEYIRIMPFVTERLYPRVHKIASLLEKNRFRSIREQRIKQFGKVDMLGEKNQNSQSSLRKIFDDAHKSIELDKKMQKQKNVCSNSTIVSGQKKRKSLSNLVKSIQRNAKECSSNETQSKLSLSGDVSQDSHQFESVNQIRSSNDEGKNVAGEVAETVKSTREIAAQNWEKELDMLRLKLKEKRQRTSQLKSDIEHHESNLPQLEAKLSTARLAMTEIEYQYNIRKKTIDMLPDASTNIQKLQESCAKIADKLMKLAEEWEKHRCPLVEEERKHREQAALRKGRSAHFIDDIEFLRNETIEMEKSIDLKEKQQALLNKKYQKMSKNINRSMYTQRIMDIIRQIHKQKVEVNKIVADIRGLQKNINNAAENLKRSDAVADEHFFQAAKTYGEEKQFKAFTSSNLLSNKDSSGQLFKDNAYIQSYRCLARVRELFEKLICCVTNIGKAENDTRDLENWINQLSKRVTSRNMDRILNDLSQIMHENNELQMKVQAAM